MLRVKSVLNPLPAEVPRRDMVAALITALPVKDEVSKSQIPMPISLNTLPAAASTSVTTEYGFEVSSVPFPFPPLVVAQFASGEGK